MSVVPLSSHVFQAGNGCKRACISSLDHEGCRAVSYLLHHSLLSPIPYEELVRLIDEASEKNLSVSILTQVRGYTTAGYEL